MTHTIIVLNCRLTNTFVIDQTVAIEPNLFLNIGHSFNYHNAGGIDIAGYY